MRIPFPNKKYSIIYADPPWSYKVWSEDTGAGRSASAHYPTMSAADIRALPVSRICAPDCALLLWVTAPCLVEGIELVSAWGFDYKTVAFTWVKQNKKTPSLFWGMGYYTRANAEFCLLATRGKPLKRLDRAVHSVVQSPIGRHSEKPGEVRDRIVRLFGADHPRIELFARSAAPGWDCWGNQAPTVSAELEGLI